jgi:hypothetical protein
MSNENGQTVCEFFSKNFSKSLYGGELSHDMIMVAIYEFSENLILHTVVAYGIFDWGREDARSDLSHSPLQWNIYTGLTVFSTIYTAYPMSNGVKAWTDHLAHASRLRFNQSCPGYAFKKVALYFQQLGNPVLLTTILLGALDYALPVHELGWNMETFYMLMFVLGSWSSWLLVAVIVPHIIFLGKRPSFSDHSDFIVDIPIHLVACNVLGEAPIHRKRHSWSPHFHVYKFFVQICWKLMVAMGTWWFVPAIQPHLEREYRLATSGHIAPQHVVIGAWFVGSIVSVVLEFIMLVTAQLGLAFLGLSFYVEASRTTL